MKEFRFAILRSRFNPEVTLGLQAGALEALTEKGIQNVDVLEAPGAYELPLMAQTLAKTRQYDGVICLGCVIKGDTAHFEFISLGAAVGLMQVQLATETPISFGVLTTYTEEQARVRSLPGQENKGREAALAVWEAAVFQRKNGATQSSRTL